MAFGRDPLAYMRGAEWDRAVLSLDRYLGHEMGAFFERTCDPSLFHRINEKDLVAVTMLGGPIPPLATVWVLGAGAADITALLVKVPRTESALWDPAVAVGKGSPLGVLERMLSEQPGMSPAKSTRLLAAKRPHLVPIGDRRVRDALRAGGPSRYRRDWHALLQSRRVRAELAALRAEVPAAVGLSLLRVAHIVISMREGGWSGPPSDRFPKFRPVKVR